MWRRLRIVSELNRCFLNVLVFPNCVQWYSNVPLLTCVSLCNTQARAVNLIHSVLCDDEGVTQARGC